ncbi:MAG: hypothetical protein NZ899_11970 [Thermoguttaceae bacterium]|nr:hypothetical protein [Thermoguttaceae bacterium]MDW8079078.1 hypothetical protein [Thermoguttaceae bacterium]
MDPARAREDFAGKSEPIYQEGKLIESKVHTGDTTGKVYTWLVLVRRPYLPSWRDGVAEWPDAMRHT